MPDDIRARFVRRESPVVEPIPSSARQSSATSQSVNGRFASMPVSLVVSSGEGGRAPARLPFLLNHLQALAVSCIVC